MFSSFRSYSFIHMKFVVAEEETNQESEDMVKKTTNILVTNFIIPLTETLATVTATAPDPN